MMLRCNGGMSSYLRSHGHRQRYALPPRATVLCGQVGSDRWASTPSEQDARHGVAGVEELVQRAVELVRGHGE
jgi:hypothetical protein